VELLRLGDAVGGLVRLSQTADSEERQERTLFRMNGMSD
jgi:hypothetical protein